MIRLTSVVVGLLCVGLLVNMGASQDKGTDKKPDDKKGMKGQLPQGWGKLKLSADQKKKIYAVQADFNGKVKVLQEQIAQLKAQEHLEMVKVLTDQQKAELAKGLVPEPNDKKPDDKKPEKK